MKSLKRIKLTAAALLSIAVAMLAGCEKDTQQGTGKNDIVVYDGNTYDYLRSKPGVYDSLVKVIDRLGLQSTLRDSNITLFAVPNQSFTTALLNLNSKRIRNNKPALDLSSIRFAFSDSAESISHLDTMVSMYIIRGQYTGDSLNFQDEVPLRGVRFGMPMNARLRVSNSSGFSSGGSQFLEFNYPHRDTSGKANLFKSKWAFSTTGAINIRTKNAIVHELTPDHVFGFDDFVFRYTYVPPPPSLFRILNNADTAFRFGGVHTTSNYRPHGTSEFFSRVYDSDIGSKFLFQGYSNSLGFWMKFQPRIPYISNAYTLTSADDDPPRDPKSWRFEGSMDDVNWVTLDTKFGEKFPRRQMTRVFYFRNTVAYKYYRIFFTENNGHSNWIQIADYTVNYKED